MTDRIERLLSELYEADPSLRAKEGVLRPLLDELLAADPGVALDPTFRAALKQHLAAQPRVSSWTRMPSWVYYPLAGAAVAVLLLVVIRRPTESGPIALRQSEPAPEMQTMNFAAPAADSGSAKMMSMQITSSVFEEGQSIPVQYTCDGASTPPPLAVTGVPEGTVSLVLIVNDPDAPRAGGFTHWVVFDIAPDAAPMHGTDGANGAGKTGYVGPCPPSGTHHYHFHLSALDAKLGLKAGATEMEVRAAMEGHVIGQAQLIGIYQRP